MNEAVLELEFDDVPDLPARPWDAEALDIAEAAALERFSSAADAFTNDKVPVAWRFVRFLGQTFIDAFDGFWVNLPGSEEVSPPVAVDLPYRTMYIEPIGLLTSAINRRTGIEWSKVFTYAAEDDAEYLKTRCGGARQRVAMRADRPDAVSKSSESASALPTSWSEHGSGAAPSSH